jgi:hypothetical protein
MSDSITYTRYAAARHVLSSPTIALRTRRYTADGRIDWHGLLADRPTMSGGEQFLVDIARRIWEGQAVPDAYELAGRLDPGNARRVVEAVDYLEGTQQPVLAAAA